jgi:Uma2 family endonuclease
MVRKIAVPEVFPRAEPVRVTRPGQPYTVEDLESLAGDENCWELVRGDLMMMSPATPPHGRFASRIDRALGAHVEDHDLGEVYIAEPGFRLRRDPDIVRAPDVAFVRKDRIPPDAYEGGFWDIAPDLAVEIISPTETAQDTQEKVDDYLNAGTGLIWLVYPRTRSAVEYRSRTQIRQLSLDDGLEGGEVVPGFRLPLRHLFR